MALADTNRVDLYYAAESSWGEDPVTATPSMIQLPFVSSSLGRNKSLVQSQTIRSDRLRDAIAEGQIDVNGDIGIQLADSILEPFYEGLLTGVIDEQTVTATTISASNTSSEFLDSGNGLGNYTVGAYIRVSGFTNNGGENDGIFRITSVTAGALGVDPAPVSDETSGDSVTIKQRLLRNGTTDKSFVFEHRFTDLSNVFQWFNGCRIVGHSLEITQGDTNAIGGSFSVMGADSQVETSSVSSGDTPAGNPDIMHAGANIGSLEKDLSALSTAVQSLSLSIDNNGRNPGQVGANKAAKVGLGTFALSGTLTAYFEDATLLNDVIGHTAVDLRFRATDPSGNAIQFSLPKIYLAGDPNIPGENQDVTLPLEFNAVRDGTLGTAMQIDFLPV